MIYPSLPGVVAVRNDAKCGFLSLQKSQQTPWFVATSDILCGESAEKQNWKELFNYIDRTIN